MGYTIGYLFERAFSIFPSWFFFSGECIEIFDLLAIFQLKNGRKVFFGFVSKITVYISSKENVVNMIVQKRDGSTEPFSKAKLRRFLSHVS